MRHKRLSVLKSGYQPHFSDHLMIYKQNRSKVSFREYSHKLGVWKELFLWVVDSHPLLLSPKEKATLGHDNQIIHMACR